MLKEYGNSVMEFKFNKDKILFYSAYNDCLNDFYYKCQCPICNNYICYFCSFNTNDKFIFVVQSILFLKPFFILGQNL